MGTRTKSVILALVVTAGICVGLRLEDKGQGTRERLEEKTVSQVQEVVVPNEVKEPKSEVIALSAPSEPQVKEAPSKDSIIIDMMDHYGEPHVKISRETAEEYYLLVKESAEENGFDDLVWIIAMMYLESNFKQDEVSSHGAVGLMQIMPKTAKGEFGVGRSELFKPEVNVPLGVKYLAKLMDHYNGDLQLATTAYNQGLGNVDRGTYNTRYLEVVSKHYDTMMQKIDELSNLKR